MIVTIYVDDILIFSNSQDQENKLKIELCKIFRMKDLGNVSSVLGVKIARNRKDGTISIDQSQCIFEILDRYIMSDCNPVSTPMDMNPRILAEMCPSTNEERDRSGKFHTDRRLGACCLPHKSQGQV